MPTPRADLYQTELDRYRETLLIDPEVALDRYGMTLLHSLSPGEKVLAMRDLGFEVKDPVDLYNLGVMHAEHENWEEAIKAFHAATDIPDAFHNLAFCYTKLGLLPQADHALGRYNEAMQWASG